jgi:hypothetical protein
MPVIAFFGSRLPGGSIRLLLSLTGTADSNAL